MLCVAVLVLSIGRAKNEIVPPVAGNEALDSAGAVVGAEKATELFEAAYDEHARRIAKYYANLGS